jgi:putative ATP-binding cassette transporter
VLAVIVLISTTLAGLLSTHLANRTGFEMRMYLCKQILGAPLRDIETAGTAKLLAALTQDIPTIAGAFLRVPGTCTSIAVLTGCLLYLGNLSLVMLLALIVFLAIAVVTYVIPQKSANRLLQLGREDWDALLKHFRAMSEGAKELKLNRQRREAFYTDLLETTAMSYRRLNVAGQNRYVLLNSWSQVCYFIVTGLILFILPSMVANINSRVLTGYAITILYMAAPLSALISIIPTFGTANISLRKLEELGLSLTTLGTEAATTTRPRTPGHDWRRLDLIGVTHTYQREQEEGSFVVGPIDLSLRPGELIFLVGGNGSGKTTLAKILTGLYAPESGEIRLDGETITDETSDFFRQHFSVVFSDFYLFDQLLGINDPDLDERARSYIEQLQLSHKLQIEGGTLSTIELSQGQRKRVALLTAYLEDRPIYVFDEWASDQDPLFRDIFYYQLLPELKAKGKTVLVISHDDRYYHIADRIVKLDYGKLDDGKYLLGIKDETLEVPACETSASSSSMLT